MVALKTRPEAASGQASVPAIEFDNVSKSYGVVPALRNVTFTVARGETLGFLGPNGAGKTTSIRILLDLIRPDSGAARVLGFDSRRQSLGVRRLIGYLPGELHLYDGMTGHAMIEYFSSLRPGAVDPDYVASLLRRLELDATKKAGALSKGNKQKLGLVLALMHRPGILLLDEPTSGLDPLVQETVSELLAEATGRGATVLLSSHVLSEVERLCHRVAFLREGQVVAVEDVATLKSRTLHIIEATFASPPPAGAFDLPGMQEIERHGETVHLQVRDELDAAVKAISRYRLLDLRTEQPSLEQVFLAYYGGKNHAGA